MPLLRVFCVDLLAFVPVREGLWILLPEAREESRRESDGTPIERHFPVALFNTGERNGSDWEEVRNNLHLQEGVERRGTVWALDREEVRIASGAPKSTRGVSLMGTRNGSLPSEENRFEASWIPRMREIAPEAARIDPACIASKVRTRKIAARMLIPSGRLRTLHFAEHRRVGFRREVRPFAFRETAESEAVGIPPRAIADGAVAEIEVEGEVTIEAARFDGQPSPRSAITLRPRGRNRTMDMVLGTLSPTSAQDNLTAGVHFELFYRLSAARVTRRPIPFLITEGEGVRALTVNSDFPDFVDALTDPPIGIVGRQICTFSMFQR